MNRYIKLAFAVFVFVFFSHAAKNVSAVELITNGSFETGTFAGWTIMNGINAWNPWQNSPAGINTGYGLGVTAPQDGTRVAWQGVAGDAGATFTLSQDISIPAGQTATFSWKDRFQQDLFTFCTGAGCGTNVYRVQVLNTSNVVLQTLYTSTALPGTRHDTGWQTHSSSLNAYAGQTVRIRFSTVVTVFYDGPGQLEVDAVSVTSLAPTAANVSVGGRVLTSEGIGIGNVSVSLTDSAGNIRSARSNPFGFYQFQGIPAGQTVIVSIRAKNYNFTQPTQVFFVQDNLDDANFISHGGELLRE